MRPTPKAVAVFATMVALVPATALATTPKPGTFEDPGHMVGVETNHTVTKADVMWASGQYNAEVKGAKISSAGRLYYHGPVHVQGGHKHLGKATIKGHWVTRTKIKGSLKHTYKGYTDKRKFTAEWAF